MLRRGKLPASPAAPEAGWTALFDGKTLQGWEPKNGSAVYTAPRADGSVRAVGIAVIVVGSRSRMCFTPLLPVLDALGAQLVTQAPG